MLIRYPTAADMSKSAFVEQLDQIQQAATKLLKPLGFRKGGRAFNRLMERGIVQVVTFQMGQYPIGDYVIPGIRESSYGSYAVNLGVLLPCVYHAHYRFPLSKTISDASCSIRNRLKDHNGNDWFRFGSGETSAFVIQRLETTGLAFLNAFGTYEDVLGYYKVNGELPFQNHGRATLEAALIHQELGNTEAARELFEKAFETDHKGFKSHVSEVARRFGHAVG
jgi:tetratricopeptide (TPR) repeat protein